MPSFVLPSAIKCMFARYIKNMRHVNTASFILLVVWMLCACGADTAMKKGDKYFALGEYYDAASYYKKAYSQTAAKERPLRGQRALKMADCYRRINQTQRAMAAYNNAVRYKQADTTALLHLAQLQLKNGSYREAEKTFLMLTDSAMKNPLIKVGLESARMAPQWKAEADYSGYTVKKQEFFNSRRAEFSPALTGDDYDQLFFSSTRNQAKGEELSGITGTKNADIFFSQKDDKGKWSKPEPIESDLNTEEDEAVVDSLGNEFLEYVQTGMTVTVKDNGIVEVA